jgi:AcrR family transcriptional regulator
MTIVMTPVIKNRALPREELKAKIYGAAIAAFREDGYDGATVEAIAARAHVAKGTFFNFYKTKLDVLTEYYWSIDARLAPLREGLDPKAPLKALTRYVEAVEREFAREGDLLIELLTQTLRSESLHRIDSDSGEADARQFAKFFASARALGTVRKNLDPDAAAALLIDVWAGAVRTWLTTGRRRSLSSIFKAKITDVFEGFGPKARTG